jgi:hypothetical protein
VNAQGADRFFVNDNETFKELTAAAGIEDESDGRGLAIGDVDDDGDVDWVVANRAGGSWLYTNGWADGTGLPRTRIDSEDGAVAAVFGDYDGDGDLDLVAMSCIKTGVRMALSPSVRPQVCAPPAMAGR